MALFLRALRLPQRISLRSFSTLPEHEKELEFVDPSPFPNTNEVGYVSRSWERSPLSRPPREVWIEGWTEDQKLLGILPLNAYVFAHPVDIWKIRRNLYWQFCLRRMNWTFFKNRWEMRGGGRKPWPQKGTGKARAGSIRAPNFKDGGAHMYGPRGPNSFYFTLPKEFRVQGLCATLSAKFAQGDIKVVPDLVLPNSDEKYMHELMDTRKWGVSALIVDVEDEFPENITKIAEAIPQVNIIPLYGLNIMSMLRHETLVLTRPAVEKLEEKLMDNLFENTVDERNKAIDRFADGFQSLLSRRGP